MGHKRIDDEPEAPDDGSDETSRIPLAGRLVSGALAGIVATLPMTGAMRRLHRGLETEDRYPLPPREIIGSAAPGLRRASAPDITIAAHFAYGAACGAGLAAVAPKPRLAAGVAGGLGIWVASYLGWIPAFGILRAATRHPAPRNRLMILSHLMWGAAYAVAQSEIVKSRAIFSGGPLRDTLRKRRGART